MITVQLQGMEGVKSMFRDIGHELSASQVRGIIDQAGQIVAKEAKSQVPEKGLIGQLLKKDIGVYRDNRKSKRNAEFVLVGPRFKQYNIHGKDQKVALIAQHMTLGFNQTDRATSKGQKRGHVAEQFHNPVTSAFQVKKTELGRGIEKGVNKQLNRVKSKYPGIVR